MNNTTTILWPASLVDAASRGECILFIGAGVSRHAQQAKGGESSPVGWRNLLEALLDQIEPAHKGRRPRNRTKVNAQINSGDYLGAAQTIESLYESKGLGVDFRNKIAGIVDGPPDNPFRPGPIHDAIADLNPRTIITTNYDNILERKFSEGYRTLTYESSSVGSGVRNGSYLILKIHGTKDDPRNLILTRLDFTRLRKSGMQALSVLEALFATRTVLFLGYSMGDPDLQLILENQFGITEEPAGHYLLAHERSHTDLDRKVLREAYGVELLTYSGDISKNLVTAVQDLALKARSLELGRSTNSI